MAGHRVSRRRQNVNPSPPPMETNDNEGQQGQEGNIGTQHATPQNVHTQANPTNLPAPPMDLAIAVMNLA